LVRLPQRRVLVTNQGGNVEKGGKKKVKRRGSLWEILVRATHHMNKKAKIEKKASIGRG